MTINSEEANLIRNALANKRRLGFLNRLSSKERSFAEIEASLGPDRFYYHLSVLERAGLVEVKDEMAMLTDSGWRSISSIPGPEALSLRPMEVEEIRQLLPCIADRSKSRIIARVTPMGEALRSAQGIFPGSSYSEDLKALTFMVASATVTVYSTGNVALAMVSSEMEAREILKGICARINGAALKPRAPAPRSAARASLPAEFSRLSPDLEAEPPVRGGSQAGEVHGCFRRS